MIVLGLRSLLVTFIHQVLVNRDMAWPIMLAGSAEVAGSTIVRFNLLGAIIRSR